MRKVVNAAIIHDNRILLVRKKQTWIFPGGKPEGGESDINCLERELAEEIPDKRLGKLTIHDFYDSFTGKSPHMGDEVEVFVYFASFENFVEHPETAREIAEAKWVDDFSNYKLAEMLPKLVNSLKEKGYLK